MQLDHFISDNVPNNNLPQLFSDSEDKSKLMEEDWSEDCGMFNVAYQVYSMSKFSAAFAPSFNFTQLMLCQNVSDDIYMYMDYI